jgi:hypothetical protein
MSAASTGTERVIRQGFKRLNRLVPQHYGQSLYRDLATGWPVASCG